MANAVSITRRLLLKHAPVAAVAVSIPVADVAAIPMPEPETLEQRRDRLFSELGDTLEALTGTIWKRANSFEAVKAMMLVDTYKPL